MEPLFCLPFIRIPSRTHAGQTACPALPVPQPHAPTNTCNNRFELGLSVKDVVKKWENKSANYKSRKTCILSNLIFVANMSKYVN